MYDVITTTRRKHNNIHVYEQLFNCACVATDVLKKRQLLHTTYKLYLVSLTLQLFYLLIMCIVYGMYASSGVENYALKTFGIRSRDARSTRLFCLVKSKHGCQSFP